MLQADIKPTSGRQLVAALQPRLYSHHALYCSPAAAGKPQRLQKKWLPAWCLHLLGSRSAPWMRVAYSDLACAHSLHIEAIMVLAALMECNTASASPVLAAPHSGRHKTWGRPSAAQCWCLQLHTDLECAGPSLHSISKCIFVWSHSCEVCALQHSYLVKEKLIKPHAHRGTTLIELLPAGELEAKRLLSQVRSAHIVSFQTD